MLVLCCPIVSQIPELAVNKPVIHEFALTYNMIEQLVSIFGVLSGGRI